MDCGIFMSKFILLAISLVFWAAGAALAYVGSYLIKSYDGFEHFIQDRHALIPAAIIIGASVLLFIIGLVGCCATFLESKVCLGCFFIIIMVVFAAEVVALVYHFTYKDQITKDLGSNMTMTFNKYGEPTETEIVDVLQKTFKCCGVYNYTSWTNTTWFHTHNSSVPTSCCKNSSSTCTGRLDQPDLIYLRGCEPTIKDLLDNVLFYAMVVVLVFAVIKFFGLLSVCVVMCKNNSHRSGYQPLYA
ncbi:tetraspanin 36 [Gouania willdenowi]|uniref:Tetraspanin n=1 Tax=Gouania willdenowi TaxID=441366 RepID=A0A8C5DKF6_GOUWI|nr:tetraspanin-36-like [Gouania willdenowi]